MKRFTVTEAHIKLLRAAYVDWCGDEFGAASIDPKRPYGNSNVLGDIARILGIERNEDGNFSQANVERMNYIHRELKTVLQIVLATGQFKPGCYVASDYGKDWQESAAP